MGTKRVIKRGKGTGTLYFDAETQKAIEEFQQTNSIDGRHELYLAKIMPAFNKLVESLIFIYGFSNSNEPIEHMKNDCVTFLYESLHKFDEADWGCVIGDEISCIKAFDGKRRKQVTRFMSKAPYRLGGTATAAPTASPAATATT